MTHGGLNLFVPRFISADDSFDVAISADKQVIPADIGDCSLDMDIQKTSCTDTCRTGQLRLTWRLPWTYLTSYDDRSMLRNSGD